MNLPTLENTSIKTANISYSCNDIRKTLAVPLINEDFNFATQITDKVWKKAAYAEDFIRFGKKNDNEENPKSLLKLFRTSTHLYISWFYFNKKENRKYPNNDSPSPSLWDGDLAEIHFGSMAPDPWHLQICIGITGITFDSSGNYAWDVDIFENEDGWGAELKLDMNQLLLTEGGVGFTICRCDMLNCHFFSWSNLTTRFHEVENYGELLFDNYNTIYTLRSGKQADKELTRSDFELLRKSYEIDAKTIIHGPYVSNPENNSVCINWATAGKLPAFLEYKRKDSNDEPIRVMCSKKYGILASEETHFAHLTNLEVNTTYQYQLFTLTPVKDQVAPSDVIRYFKTAPKKEDDFSFFCVTDLHSNANFLTQALKTQAANDSSFHLLLGDNLSHAAGRKALYKGVIDPIVSVNQEKENDTPIVFVRGNHEEMGVFAKEYFNVMRHHTGNSWYAFSYGNCFFVILDCGHDAPDRPDRLIFSSNELLAEQKLFLQKVVNLPEYQNATHRIAFIHIPPLTEKDPQLELIKTFVDAKAPLSVLLSGHWHEYITVDKNTTSFGKGTSPAVVNRLKSAYSLPFPRIVLSTNSSLHCKVTKDSLTLDICQYLPDGKLEITDNIVINK